MRTIFHNDQLHARIWRIRIVQVSILYARRDTITTEILRILREMRLYWHHIESTLSRHIVCLLLLHKEERPLFQFINITPREKTIIIQKEDVSRGDCKRFTFRNVVVCDFAFPLIINPTVWRNNSFNCWMYIFFKVFKMLSNNKLNSATSFAPLKCRAT